MQEGDAPGVTGCGGAHLAASLAWWALTGGANFGVRLQKYTCFSTGSMQKPWQGVGLRVFFHQLAAILGG